MPEGNPKGYDGEKKELKPAEPVERVADLPEASGPALKIGYAVGKKGSTESRPVGSFAGGGK